jgi:Tol biopolymer transport system component
MREQTYGRMALTASTAVHAVPGEHRYWMRAWRGVYNRMPGKSTTTMRSAIIGSPFLFLVLFFEACGGDSGAPPPPPTTPQPPDIVFASRRALDGSDAANTNSAQNIWAVNGDGTNAVALTRLTGQGQCAFPGVVPGCQAPPNDGIFSSDPAWSPDKTKIAFGSNRAGDGSDGLSTSPSWIWTVDVDGSHQVPLTNYPGDSFDPYHHAYSSPAWSPDGLKLSVVQFCCLDIYPNVALVNADGSIFPNSGYNLDVLTGFGGPIGTGTSSGRWSPDGLKLIFDALPESSHGFDSPRTPRNIWVINADGSGQTPLLQLTNLTDVNASSFDPNWSPDGSEVAFSSSRALDGSDAANANGTVNIWVMKADGTDVGPLTKLTAAGADCVAASWSPDGTKLALECARALDGSDSANANLTVNIWVVNADGTGAIPLTNLTAAGASSHDIAWSPDGSKLAFDSLRAIDGSDLANAASNIWIMNSDGSGANPLTKNTTKGADSVQPKWHP